MKNLITIVGDTAIIAINHKGKTVKTFIDAEDVEKVKAFQSLSLGGIGLYVYCQRYFGGKREMVRLHRLVTDCPPGLVVDHQNFDVLDNRKANLRIVTTAENTRNRQYPGRGVTFNKTSGKWMANVRYNSVLMNLGYFETEEEALSVATEKRRELGLKIRKA